MYKILGYDANKIYMVHVTGYFPKNHKILSTYDGNKIYDVNEDGEKIKIYMGNEAKNVVVPSHRHTVHFTLNCVVENTKDGAGNWDGIPMAVVEPMKQHKTQFLSYGSGDSWTWGSVELSDNAIIFINKESLDLIPEEEKEKWKIVVCNEDISQAVKHFFKKNNIPQIPYEDHPGHQMNEEYNLESNLQSRDKAINYVKDNKFDGKSDIQFTMQEFLDIMRIFQDSQNRMPISTKISLVEIINASNNQQGYSLFSNTNYGDIPSKVIDIIMSCGFYLTEEGSIKLKDDEEIYNFLVNPKSLAEKTISESKELYMKYVEFLYSKPQSELLDFENEIIERTLQDIKEKNYEELSENEKRIIDRILNVRESDLSQLSKDEITIIKNMKPKCYNEINDKCSIQVIYSDDGTVDVYVYGDTVDDYTELSNKFQNINGIKLNEIVRDCELRIDGQQENETFGEFYSRVQGVIDAFAEILTSDEDLSECFKFSSSGVLDKRKHDKVNALLSSAIETTCEVTRTGKINEQIMKIHECQRDKDKSPFEINQ